MHTLNYIIKINESQGALCKYSASPQQPQEPLLSLTAHKPPHATGQVKPLVTMSTYSNRTVTS